MHALHGCKQGIWPTVSLLLLTQGTSALKAVILQRFLPFTAWQCLINVRYGHFLPCCYVPLSCDHSEGLCLKLRLHGLRIGLTAMVHTALNGVGASSTQTQVLCTLWQYKVDFAKRL